MKKYLLYTFGVLAVIRLEANMDLVSAALEKSQAKQEVISVNIAGAMQPGYKGNKLVVIQKETSDMGENRNVIPTYISMIDFSQGPIQATGISTDLALEGDAVFFELTDPYGEKVYTRKGTFSFDKDNQLVSPEGYVVSNNASAPLVKMPGNADIEVSSNGGIYQMGQKIGSIGVFQAPLDQLERCNGGFKLPKKNLAQTAEKFKIHQRCIEGSNVLMANQTIELMQASQDFNLNADNLKIMKDNFSQLLQTVQSF